MQRAATRPVPAHRRPAALVVEDDGFERLRLTALLEQRGFEVTSASDGAEALASLATRRADVLVTDWQLPAVSGIDLCRALRSTDPAERPFTILVTARDGIEDLVEGLEAGADDFLTKPYCAEELTARLRSGQRVMKLRRELGERTRMLEQALRHQGQMREDIDADLAAATRLQFQLLERSVALIPGLDVAHLFRPARQVGGDLFGITALAADRAAFFHIDATGHGISAALHAFAIAAALQGLGGRAAELEDPAAWVAGFNDRALGLGNQLSCSLVVGWLDVRTRIGRLCQAGHPYPVAVRPDGTLRRLGTGGLPVGTLDGARYCSTDFALAPRERLVVYSDGVTDCVNPSGLAFGQPQLERALMTSAPMTLADSIRAVGRALDDWRGVAGYQDDVSLLALQPACEV